jgi:hypothetical protein
MFQKENLVLRKLSFKEKKMPGLEEELLGLAKEDIENKYKNAPEEEERRREQSGIKALGGISLTSSINPFNIAKRREFLEALGASQNIRRADEDLALRRSGQEHQQRMAERAMEHQREEYAERKRQALEKEEQARQTFGLNREIFQQSRLKDAQTQNLEMRRLAFKRELDNREISIKEYSAKMAAMLQLEGINVTARELEYRMEHDKSLLGLSVGELGHKIESDASAKGISSRQTGVQEKAELRNQQARQQEVAMAPMQQQADWLYNELGAGVQDAQRNDLRAAQEAQQREKASALRVAQEKGSKKQVNSVVNAFTGLGQNMANAGVFGGGSSGQASALDKAVADIVPNPGGNGSVLLPGRKAGI